MVIDSSVLVSIALKEADHEQYINAIRDPAQNCSVSAGTLLETRLVLSKDENTWPALHDFIHEHGVNVVSFTEKMMEQSMDGFLKFGKGRGNKAKLNYGDCIAYGTAKALDRPLLFKGNDFPHTDIQSVL